MFNFIKYFFFNIISKKRLHNCCNHRVSLSHDGVILFLKVHEASQVQKYLIIQDLMVLNSKFINNINNIFEISSHRLLFFELGSFLPIFFRLPAMAGLHVKKSALLFLHINCYNYVSGSSIFPYY